jgi:predicted NUDIX family NTP pyrophosphohydrolase
MAKPVSALWLDSATLLTLGDENSQAGTIAHRLPMTKAPKRSAGLLMYRRRESGVEVFLVHPGGPFWTKKDQGAWTLPKGEYEADEDPLEAARREFQEETGFLASGKFIELSSVRQKSGKIVIAWAFEGDCDPAELVSNTCEIEWPPHSGKRMEIPEVDRGRWFGFAEAHDYIRAEQGELLDRLEQHLLSQFS